jgi:SAM-dependent MidA family methyltransferase
MRGGDFLTAPEITPLFAQALARQVAQVLSAVGPIMIEAGAGSGRLAADLLPALDALGCLPRALPHPRSVRALRARQQATLAQARYRLPGTRRMAGYPARRIFLAACSATKCWTPCPARTELGRGRLRRGNRRRHPGPADRAARPAAGALLSAAQALSIEGPWRGEISLAVRAWISDLSRRLEQGALLLIDYGLPRHELYHPQRDGGSIRCHYRHRVHQDAFWYPGSPTSHRTSISPPWPKPASTPGWR